MRNAVRLAALMNLPVVYQFTHDTVFLGEDGPTHQPVEHLASLRAMPNLNVCRPADENEVKAAWYTALTAARPTAIILSRQNIQSLNETSFDSALKGGYVLKEDDQAEITIFATGSECALALDVANKLSGSIKARVVSLVSWELFEEQSSEYKKEVIGNCNLNVSIEAQSSFGWARFTGSDGLNISIDSFGKSGTYNDIQEHFGFTANQIIEEINKKVALVKTA